MVESTRDEAGVLIYERFNSEDSMNVLVYERYSDSNSALAHLKAYRKRFEERFGSLVERKRFSVLGSPSRELRAELNGLGVTEYLSPMAGFSEQKRE